MISGELDILKDWCYEAVSFLLSFFFSDKKKKNTGGLSM
jgi:hypothetical protein